MISSGFWIGFFVMDKCINKAVKISVVSPIYGCPSAIPELCMRLHSVLQGMVQDYEIILVEDGSPDDSWQRICCECEKDSRVVGVKLSRNFGQHYAITAGLDFALGEWVVVMDCDLQDRPEDIVALYAKALEGKKDIILARRMGRKDHWRKRFCSIVFYRVFSWLTGTCIDPSVGTFRMMHRKTVVAFRKMGEVHRLFGGMVQWLGFDVGYVEVSHSQRHEGKSSYSMRGLLKLGIDGILSFSTRPLLFGVGIGAGFALLASLYAVYLLMRLLLVGPFGVAGWITVVLLVSFLGGVILMNLGLLGIYIGRIYEQVKGRPVYVVGKVICRDAHSKRVASHLNDEDAIKDRVS